MTVYTYAVNPSKHTWNEIEGILKINGLEKLDYKIIQNGKCVNDIDNVIENNNVAIEPEPEPTSQSNSETTLKSVDEPDSMSPHQKRADGSSSFNLGETANTMETTVEEPQDLSLTPLSID